MHRAGWVANHDGNLSVRVQPNRLVVTATGMSKADMTLDDLVVVMERVKRLLDGAVPLANWSYIWPSIISERISRLWFMPTVPMQRHLAPLVWLFLIHSSPKQLCRSAPKFDCAAHFTGQAGCGRCRSMFGGATLL